MDPDNPEQHKTLIFCSLISPSLISPQTLPAFSSVFGETIDARSCCFPKSMRTTLVFLSTRYWTFKIFDLPLVVSGSTTLTLKNGPGVSVLLSVARCACVCVSVARRQQKQKQKQEHQRQARAGGIQESRNPLPQHLRRDAESSVCVARRTVTFAIRPRVALEWIPGFLDSVIIGGEVQESGNPGIQESTQTSPGRRSG